MLPKCFLPIFSYQAVWISGNDGRTHGSATTITTAATTTSSTTSGQQHWLQLHATTAGTGLTLINVLVLINGRPI